MAFLLLEHLFLALLKRTDRTLYATIGVPRIGGSNLDKRYWLLPAFIWSLKFLHIQSWWLRAVGLLMMVVEIVGVASFVLLLCGAPQTT